MNKMNMRTFAALLSIISVSMLAASCHYRQEADVMRMYSYRDTLYAQPFMLPQDTLNAQPSTLPQDTTEYYLSRTLPGDTVLPDIAEPDTAVADTICYSDSLTATPILIFNSSLQLPVPSRHKEIAYAMNDTILYRVLTENSLFPAAQWPQVFEPHADPDTLLRRLYCQLEPIVRKNIPPSVKDQHYYFGVSGNFVFFSEKLLTYQLRYTQYTLGAHANHRTQYLVFDLATGRPLRENDVFVVSDENRQGIAALLREAYKEFLAKDTMDRQGLTWNASALKMNGNFAVEKDGIVYRYNAYEAGPYALGALELKLLSYKLQPYLRKESPVYKLWFK